jgi:hypothetical protein
MQSAADGALDIVERIFFYMPLQHSEVRRCSRPNNIARSWSGSGAFRIVTAHSRE